MLYLKFNKFNQFFLYGQVNINYPVGGGNIIIKNMLTNILLGLILGTVITSFVILNNKINRTEFNTKFIINALKRINQFVEANNIVINHIQDKFNKQILYNLPVRLETFITEENNAIRKEIKKQAKISSKIKSQSKINNNINKQ